MVHFVGAGSGAPDLITVRGQRLLQEADMIIYAGSLVDPRLLENARPDCEIYDSSRLHLDEVMDLMKRAHDQGRTVVRLHTGDPSIYGAVREQMDRLSQTGIDHDVCPGVSSFCGAAATLRREYTLPGVSQTLILTRMEGRTPVPEREKIRSLAAHGASMAVFLSASMLDKLRDELIAGGVYTGDTPCAIVYKATWPDEKKIITRLADLADEAEKAGINKTALILVGDFLGDGYQLSKLYDPGFSTGFRKAAVKNDSLREQAADDTTDLSGRRVMSAGVVCFTDRGLAAAERIAGAFENTKDITGPMDIYRFGSMAAEDPAVPSGCRTADSPERTINSRAGDPVVFDDTADLVSELFDKKDLIIFIGAAGIAVRHISPFINSKLTDPAVISADEELKHFIPLLSGHLGGANAAAADLAGATGGLPVITTASDVQGLKAVDTIAWEKGFRILDMKAARRGTAALLKGGRISIRRDPDWTFRIDDINIPVRFLPYVIGVGCRKGTDPGKLYGFISEELEAAGIDRESVWRLCSIDLKKDEPAVRHVADRLGIPFYVFSSDQLAGIDGDFSGSDFVRSVTGVDNVCERSAAAGCGGKWRLLVRKKAREGMTIAVAERDPAEVTGYE